MREYVYLAVDPKGSVREGSLYKSPRSHTGFRLFFSTANWKVTQRQQYRIEGARLFELAWVTGVDGEADHLEITSEIE